MVTVFSLRKQFVKMVRSTCTLLATNASVGSGGCVTNCMYFVECYQDWNFFNPGTLMEMYV